MRQPGRCEGKGREGRVQAVSCRGQAGQQWAEAGRVHPFGLDGLLAPQGADIPIASQRVQSPDG